MALVETTHRIGKTTSRTRETIKTNRIGDHQTLIGKIRDPIGINSEILLNQVKSIAIIATSLAIYFLNVGFVHNNIILQLYPIHRTLRRTLQSSNP